MKQIFRVEIPEPELLS